MRYARFLFSCVIPWPMLQLSLGAWSPITAYRLKRLCAEPGLPVNNLVAITVVSHFAVGRKDLQYIGKERWWNSIL